MDKCCDKCEWLDKLQAKAEQTREDILECGMTAEVAEEMCDYINESCGSYCPVIVNPDKEDGQL